MRSTASLPPLFYIHFGLQRIRFLSHVFPIFLSQILSQFVKNIHNSLIFFGRTLPIFNLIFFSQILSFFSWRMIHITFISNKKYTFLCNSLLQSFVYVIITSFYSWFIWKIKYNNTTLWTFVVCWSKCSKFLLTSSIPNLQRVQFFINGGGVCFEINTNGRKISCVEFRLTQSKEDRTLSNSLWSNYYHLESSTLNISLTFIHFLNDLI